MSLATLNITYGGRSADVQVGASVTDADVRLIAAEVMRHGQLAEIHEPHIRVTDLDNFVVDRFQANGRTTIYLRPKVPFGDMERVSEI